MKQNKLTNLRESNLKESMYLLFFFSPDQEVLTALHIYSSDMIALGENSAKILKTG